MSVEPKDAPATAPVEDQSTQSESNNTHSSPTESASNPESSEEVPKSQASSPESKATEARATTSKPSWEGDSATARDTAEMFSPPPYKTDRFAATSSQEPNNNTMDFADVERRDFDQLDLNADLSGPDDPLMIAGSFAEDSPQKLQDPRSSPTLERDSERKKSQAAAAYPRRSPSSHPYGYQQPSYSGPPPPPPHGAYRRSSPPSREGYRSTPSSRGPPPPGYPYPGYPPHGSPPSGYRDSRGNPNYYPGYSSFHHYHPEYHPWERHHYSAAYDQEDEIPPPPPSSTKKSADQAPPSPRAHLGTPEKQRGRSPFRSPPQSLKSKFRRSPYMGASPQIGTFGSFGLDTPSGTLAPADFSPMGPSLQNFDENAPLPMSGEMDFHDDTETPIFRRNKEEPSPFTGLMDDLSPMEGLHGIARSPMVDHTYDAPGSHERDYKGVPVTMSSGRRDQRIHSTPHGSVKKALWPRSDETPGRVRMEIGTTGSLSTRKSIEGINSMMQARSRDPAPSPRDRPPSRSHHRAPHHPSSYRDAATPLKATSHNVRQTPSSSRHPSYGYRSGPHSATKPHYAPPSVPASTSKSSKKKATSPKRSPCNCKKSKCLKLYCECFAAERFCKDCNCADCFNTPTAGKVREKAIKDTKAKNPNAFKSRFSAKGTQGPSNESSHNMGCRCKRSQCLKKYCECFQAGVLCAGKCKCSDCLNYRGSQALIDKRRKIKDQRGADFAMRVADEAWKEGRGAVPRKPAAPAAAISRRPGKSPAGHSRMPPPPHMMQPSPRNPPPPGHRGHHPHAYPPPYMHGPMPVGYPMGIPMTPAGYPHPPHLMPGDYPPPPGHPSTSSSRKSMKRPAHHVTPMVGTPKTPGVRVKFDPASSRKKRKVSPGQSEATLPFFGNKFPEQPKTTALAIFSFLSNDDLYNAGLVCKSWSQLAMDGELWNFGSLEV